MLAESGVLSHSDIPFSNDPLGAKFKAGLNESICHNPPSIL